MLLNRIPHNKISPSRRALQLLNTGLERVAARPLNLVHVVEYPKCGGSWVRNMIRTYRDGELFGYDRLIRRGDVIMAHKRFHPRFVRPIVVVRDPRDMLVSFYYYENTYEHSDQNSPLFKYFTHDPARPLAADFLAYAKVKLLEVTHPWFFYSQFLDSWLNRPDVCVVRYEDCLADPHGQLARMMRFTGDTVDLQRIDATVEATSFKAVTREKYGEERAAGQADNARFHRKGVAGDWQGHFNREACELLQRLEGESLRRLGYEADAGWIDRHLAAVEPATAQRLA